MQLVGVQFYLAQQKLTDHIASETKIIEGFSAELY